MALTKFSNGISSFVSNVNATEKSANFTAVANTNYRITATCVATLPAIAVGNTFTFVIDAPDGTAQLSISPAAADGIAYGGSFADNKDLINTLATSKRGDFVTLISGDQVVYWITSAAQGTWAKEA